MSKPRLIYSSSIFCPLAMSHHIINEFFAVLFGLHYCQKLVEKEGDLMSVDLLHRPAVGGLQALVVAQDVLIRGKLYAFPASSFGSFTSFWKVMD